ncbi:DUF5691 domain-containing protein [Desulfogranum japonicum]|uniref:DUF5691 domain-containing protein n=1 Tax=Desulfogranum japonicum TaxID=231447 RepID=UPI000410BCA8|nr:DUF5691 domain-containing protein [Desulfogranum japonicum]
MLNQDELQQALAVTEQLQRQWMIGAGEVAATVTLPESWSALLQGTSPEHARLLTLALTGQLQLMMTSGCSGQQSLHEKPLLPMLAVPTLPESLRPLFRRSLEGLSKQRSIDVACVLRLLSQRRVTAHPADWLPTNKEKSLPREYWPWCRWVADVAAMNTEAGETLSEDTWDQFYPAERLALLQDMRALEPDSARELIMQCAGREPADKRLSIVGTLAVNLAPADVDYLQSLLQDRSKKIATLASQMLSRLGTLLEQDSAEMSEEEVQEHAETYTLEKKGILKKRLRLRPKKMRSGKQNAIRTERLGGISLSAFARVLGLKVTQLLDAWDFEDNRPSDNLAFLTNAASTLSDDHIEHLLARLLSDASITHNDISLLEQVVARLSPEARQTCVQQILRGKDATLSFYDCLLLVESPLDDLLFTDLKNSGAWKALCNRIGEEFDGGYLENLHCCAELTSLGLLVPQATAAAVLDAVESMGLSLADPALDLLQLNNQLPILT